MRRRGFTALALVAATGLLVACRGSDTPSITVAAASDLGPVLDEGTAEIEEACGVELQVTLGSSGLLANQVAAGAPYDVYLSADAQFPHNLVERGLASRDEVVAYAIGRIAITWADGVESIDSIEGLLRNELRRVAIANPEHAPYGRAAEEALVSSGLLDALQPRLVIGENIRQTYDYIRGGNADAGIVAVSLVVRADRGYTLVDSSLHELIVQSGMVVAGRPNGDEAWCVLNYFSGNAGQDLLADYGFESVP